MVRIDSHQHFWDIERVFQVGGATWFLGGLTYAWTQAGLPSLVRSFLPGDLAPQMKQCGIEYSVLVNVLHSLGETRWMLELAEADTSIAGVVGWVNLAQPAEIFARELEAVRHPRLVGIRHLTQFEPQDHWLLRPDVLANLRILAAEGLAYDLLLHPGQLADMPTLSDKVPELRMVVDHAAKPQIKDALLEPWATDLRIAAANPLLYCKLSGLVTEGDHRHWTPVDLRRYIEVVLESFGVERVMFGSDWPVCTLAGTYAQVYEALMDNLTALLQRGYHDDMNAIFGGNAARFYRLDLP